MPKKRAASVYKGTPWTPMAEEALVKALYSRREVLHVWLPASADGPFTPGTVLNESGQYHPGKVYLQKLAEDIAGDEPAVSTGNVRNKLKMLFRTYFTELSRLNAFVPADMHTTPVDQLPVGNKYRKRRKRVAETYPWWDLMHAMMVEYRREVVDSSSVIGATTSETAPKGARVATAKTERTRSQLPKLSSPGTSSPQTTASNLEKEHPSWEAAANSLQLQIDQLKSDFAQDNKVVENERLKMELALAKKDIKISRLREKVRVLETQALQAADRDGEERRSEPSKGDEKCQAQTQSGHRFAKDKGKELEAGEYVSDIPILSSDDETDDEDRGEGGDDSHDDDDGHGKFPLRKKQRR